MKSSKSLGGSFADKQLSSLRSYAQWRILKDMIDQARKNCAYNKEYLVMVVDTQALKVFSSSCKFYDLYQQKLY